MQFTVCLVNTVNSRLRFKRRFFQVQCEIERKPGWWWWSPCA